MIPPRDASEEKPMDDRFVYGEFDTLQVDNDEAEGEPFDLSGETEDGDADAA